MYAIRSYYDCRKLHSEVPELNALGIKVRYLAFPRAGIDSPTYEKSVSIWCAADRKAAMTTAKDGGEVAKATCDNPVADELKLGIKLGVRGTPTRITSYNVCYTKLLRTFMLPAR